ncbi:class I SAM-dependent methyltransferase [Actinoplanes utahensis]|uniref:Ubiquinone biosynthesis methyltransferase UbiE n=1 Tax=Actinoplanes utahensis TaxID=1869 RepID=A0A0A6XA51_ACTUT|nr:class I SAM-dependent methyltransferase [Actinoplanes utahensis]KHD76992.1 ubiquinone biosynthesis methyltransferase UbiE [Actinoplanes utahensis]
MPPPTTIAKSRRVWDRQAARYDRGMRYVEARLLAGGREWVASRATGRVLEVAVGTGLTLRHYPADIQLTGIELAPAMLDIARRRATALGRPADLREGDAHALSFPDESFDTVTCVLSLCAIADSATALTEMRRVLRPGGRLLLLDHVASTSRALHLLQWLVERVTLPLQGERFTQRTLPLVRATGFDIIEQERLKAGVVQRIHARKAPSG